MPKTHYARSGEASIAYQVLGDAERDLVIVPPFVSHLEISWEHPPYTRFMNRLSEFARVIVFDKRGSGLSDPLTGSESFEQRVDDVVAVMDSAGSERAALLGISEGAPMATLMAATHPERVSELIIFGGFAKAAASDDYPEGQDEYSWEVFIEGVREAWGEGVSLISLAPTKILEDDKPFREWWGRFERAAASPRMAHNALALDKQIDIREALPTVQAPTLLLHRTDDTVPVEGARYLQGQIPGARLVELDGGDHWPWIGDTDVVNDEVEEFLTGTRPGRKPDRVLATVLFTDIVSSTQRAAELGDRRWRELLADHERLTRRELEHHRGREVKNTGDGFLATFDGPARGVRCAQSLTGAVRELGIELRAGLHTGECELLNGDVGGIAVHIGARVSAVAGPGEVVVSSTVKDLVVGSGIEFAERGVEQLKGVPGEWRLFAVERD